MERPPIEQRLVADLEALQMAPSTRFDRRLVDLFDVQVASRHCDLAARWLRSMGKGYYTIGSAGHESNAAVAMALQPADPALLHYRSGAFYLVRAGLHGVDDILAGVVAATVEPISGGRHKVFGRHDLAIIPQTSTIASHLPRAVGVAWSIDRARKLGVASPWPDRAIAMCSFGDASANHATATAALNTAVHSAYQGLAMPLLFVCEDNGRGISVPTPTGWIETMFANRAGLRYAAVDGDDPLAVLEVADELVDHVRSRRRPALLRLSTVRLGGHAGSDLETAYRSPTDIRADAGHDPILGTAKALVAAGVCSPVELLARHDEIRRQVYERAEHLAAATQLTTADEVMSPIAPRRPRAVADATTIANPTQPQTLAQGINATLADELRQRPNMLLFGEDVANKGGVYGVTKGLVAVGGARRVFDTLLDETSILGLALGAAISGFLPVPEIQYLAYLHNAQDQLRGEAATMSFFSNGQYRNGMVVRVAGYGYQEGFGGHFHNDDSIAVLLDIPGLVVATPARADDASAILRTCLAAAATDGTVSVIVEPIARYHTVDLHESGDGAWLATPDAQAQPIGKARVYGDGADLTIITSGNGVYLSLRAARRLAEAGIAARVVDLRWLTPLPVDDIVDHAAATAKVLVVDETRATGGISQHVVTALIDRRSTADIRRVASRDSFIPLGDAAKLVLLSEDTIVAAAISMMG